MNNTAHIRMPNAEIRMKSESRNANVFPVGKREKSNANGFGFRILVILSAALLLVSLRLPLWQMRMEAPQYRGKEALHISVHPNALRGDLQELKVLDQYIGVHVPKTLPQFKWLPDALVAGAVLGIVAVLLGASVRRKALLVVALGLIASLAVAAAQAESQMRAIGHDRDAHAPLVGVGDFTPPFLGTTKIAQFEVTSRFGLGAWFIGAALALQLGAACISRRGRSMSLTSGFSPVNETMENPGAVSTASRTRKTVETVSTFKHATLTGLKPGANENRSS